MDFDKPLTFLGISFILIGIALVLIPLLAKLVPEPDLARIPWFLLYVYRGDGFIFATSPLLLAIGIAYFAWIFFHR